MIDIKKSNNFLRMSKYEFEKNRLLIGSHIAADIFSSEDNLNKTHAIIEIIDSKLYIILDNDISHIHVNGKKTTGKKLLHKNDIITLESLEFKILDYEKKIYMSVSQLIDENMVKLRQKNSKFLDIINSMSSQDE